MIENPYLLLSVVNTALRNKYEDLNDYCLSENVSYEEIVNALEKIGYRYDEEQNCFKND
ncbi:MAG: DUF4250 domain-containing protein [Clostridia bacterium]|nr:DUF4250 domain-containing protein [Clostridia bacterium]